MANVTVSNTDAQLSAKTLITADGTQTITGAKTFDLDPSAPFAVSSGSAVVPNLDADKLDGYQGSELGALAENETVSGSWTFSSALTLGSSLTNTSIITPSQITASQNNYNPTNLSTAFNLFLDLSAAWDITGIVAQSSGRLILITNGSTFALTLKHASGSSSAANTFVCPNAADVVVRQGGSVFIFYAASRWRVVGI